MQILGLIPARAGSKGLPDKNIRSLAGKPLISYTIEQALGSKYLDRVVVSTDGSKIAAIASKCGAEVPFLRPAGISGDDARRIDAVFHALDWYEKQGRPFDAVMLLQPTSPLRTSTDIDAAIEFAASINAAAVISVCQDRHPPFWSSTLPADKCMKDFMEPDAVGKNRQAFGTYYRLNGAIFFSKVDYLRENGEFLGPGTFAYEMPAAMSVDIDDDFDFLVAETLVQTPRGAWNTA